MNADPTLARRAANTPARDWLRGRLTGRLDWRRDLATADLPAPIAELITAVVRRTRLWRLERADVARELITHFADALAAGTSQEQAVNDFGDTVRTARLIRRARKRNRHWTYRAFIHSCQGLLAVFVALFFAYGLLAWRFFSGEPTITRNFTAEYNETIERIPEQDRAWEYYIETYAELEPVSEELAKSWPATAPEHPRYTEALAYLERQQGVLETIHRAAALPRLGAPFYDQLDPRIIAADNARNPEAQLEAETPSENPMLIGVLLPELGHMRALARLLTFDAHVAAAEGDGARVTRDLETMLGLASHAGDRPVVICGLVEIAIHHLASDTLAQIINAQPEVLTDEQLRTLAHRFAAADLNSPRDALRGERWVFEDMVQRVYTDDGEGSGHLTAEGLRTLMNFTSLAGSSQDLIVGSSPLGPITAALVADRASLMAKYNELMAMIEARAQTPMWEYDTLPRASDLSRALAEDPIDNVRYFPIDALMPSLDRAAESAEYAEQYRDALLAGIAIELYRRDQGSLPDSLDRLVPTYLPAFPRDRYTGQPLHYAPTESGPRLWSVGLDRDDDQGVAPADATNRSWRWHPAETAARYVAEDPEQYDGDWILWPIVYEPVTSDDD